MNRFLLDKQSTVEFSPKWPSVPTPLRLIDLSKVMEHCAYLDTASVSTVEIVQSKGLSRWSLQNLASAGSVLSAWPSSFEQYLFIREAAESQAILVGAIRGGRESLLAHRVGENLGLSVTVRLLSLVRTHPECPFLVLNFASKVLALEPVESIVCEKVEEGLRVWTVVNNASETQRYAIYDNQWEAMQGYSDIDVDFRLVDRYDRPLEQLANFSESAETIRK